ncbi:MAG: metallophosphoesterase [Desulfobulbaceae bacterium]|uniref:Metallophosphoesterase n=1 Tax=Candidatus Desulfobia pelagia TaxID=2841692 RepID=A0A8J6NF79_9BACT|nr:metallophosphoesterase [Candidatus Desulfobia pelagia]
MKLHVLSDLHLEFGGPFVVPDVDRDVLVLGGDIGVGPGALEFIQDQAKKSPVILVLGNHEYYKHDFGYIRHYWGDTGIDGLHLLDNCSTLIDGIRFLGTTLWTDFAGGNGPVMRFARERMYDFLVIEKNGKPFSPVDALMEHERSKKWLVRELTESAEPVMVITHHAPSYNSINGKFRGNRLNPAFASHLDEIIREYQPRLWIHGHMHDSFDYMIGETRIVCNPRGYAGYQLNERFKIDLVIEV